MKNTDNDWVTYIHQVFGWIDNSSKATVSHRAVALIEYRNGILDLHTRRLVSGVRVLSNKKGEITVEFKFRHGPREYSHEYVRLYDNDQMLYYIEPLRMWVLCKSDGLIMSEDEVLSIPIAYPYGELSFD